MLRADEEGFSIPFKCKWNRETGQMWTKISNFVQFINKKRLLQCKFKYNDNTTEIEDS